MLRRIADNSALKGSDIIYGEKFVAATHEFSCIIDFSTSLSRFLFPSLPSLPLSFFLSAFFLPPLETLTLSHYLKFSKVFPGSSVLFAFVCISTQRKADVNDASSANLFPINTVLTSGRLGFSQKKTRKRRGSADGAERAVEKHAEQSYTVHIPLTYE